MNISICCPSYKRPIVKSLKYVPYAKIYIDKSEYEEYKKENPDANIIVCDDGIQGNVARVRNYILNKEFHNGTDVVCIIDDDLQGIYRFDVNKKTKFGYERNLIENLEEFIYKYSVICSEFGYKLWGGKL